MERALPSACSTMRIGLLLGQRQELVLGISRFLSFALRGLTLIYSGAAH